MADPNKPEPRHRAIYRSDGRKPPGDGRIYAPTFDRNSAPMVAQLAPWFLGRSGVVLEIGAGTGQHAAAFALAFPILEWWPTDPDAQHRASIKAWQKFLRAPERPPFDLDGASDWPSETAVRSLGPLSAIISMNVIHIAPYAVAKGIIAGAPQALAPGGLLIFYGPFREQGRHTGPGNKSFDQGLRSENPDWGLRDTDDINDLARQAGLEFSTMISMPANNRLLIFKKP